MSMKRSLQIIAGIALSGLCFSGYLPYQDLFSARPASCPALGASGTS